MMVGTFEDKIQQLRETIAIAADAVKTFGPNSPYVASLAVDISKLFDECYVKIIAA
jgi:hypothetical protein